MFFLRGFVGGGARGDWQLQHARALAFAQSPEQHDLPAGEFERIVIHVRLVVVELPEPRHLFTELSVRQEGAKREVVFHFVLEREFRARKQTNRTPWLSHSSETPSDRAAELRRHQLIANLCRSGCDMLQTVVTHRSCSSPAYTSN